MQTRADGRREYYKVHVMRMDVNVRFQDSGFRAGNKMQLARVIRLSEPSLVGVLAFPM